jgi:heme/copper-type cytochrome/quinol oxidase subunit 3
MKKLAYRLENKKNKKGVVIGTVIFILLNLAFFAMLLFFVVDRCTGTSMKEKVLAKEIALFINSAEPNTLILLDVKSYKEIAENNKIKPEDFIKIEGGRVRVALSGGFVYPHFSNYQVEGKLSGNFFEISIK